MEGDNCRELKWCVYFMLADTCIEPSAEYLPCCEELDLDAMTRRQRSRFIYVRHRSDRSNVKNEMVLVAQFGSSNSLLR